MSLFDSAIFDAVIFDTGGAAVVTVDTHDAADYRRYRRRLEKAAKAADEYNQSKYVRQAVKAAEIVDELQIASPVIEKIAEAVKAETMPEFDFSALQGEFSRVRGYLDDLIALKAEAENEDELIIMMSLM